MDIRLPGMGGIEAMGRIIEEDRTVPIIIVTTYGTYKDNYLTWAANVFLTKSSDLSPLKESIRSLFERRIRRSRAERPRRQVAQDLRSDRDSNNQDNRKVDS